MALLTAAALAVTAAATVGSAYMAKAGARKAAKARAAAIEKMGSIDAPALQALARRTDEERYRGILDLQKQVDPGLAKLRQNSIDQLAANSGPQPTDAQVDQLAQNIYAENVDDPESRALRQKLLADAQAQLDAGATLPPDFQAELVRTGLESGTASGMSGNRAGAVGRNLRQVLGVAGQALKQQRVQSALAQSQGAQTIADSRARILSGTIAVLNGIPEARLQRAKAGFDVAQGALPERGLTGKELVGLDMARLKDENAKLGKLGDIEAEKKLADYAFYSSAIGAGGGLVSGGLDMWAESSKVASKLAATAAAAQVKKY